VPFFVIQSLLLLPRIFSETLRFIPVPAKMVADTLPLTNGVVANGDLGSNPNPSAAKKSRESERRRRRRKQKKNNKASQAADPSSVYDNYAEDEDAKENSDTQQVFALSLSVSPCDILFG
jgi:hypothetical protein